MAFCWIVQVIMAFLCVFECHEKPSKSFLLCMYYLLKKNRIRCEKFSDIIIMVNSYAK